MSQLLYGNPVTGNIVIGMARHYHDRLDINKHKIDPSLQQQEITRFHQALREASEELSQIEARVSKRVAAEVTEFIHTHQLMLADLQFIESVETLITQHSCNSEWALALHRDELAEVFSSMEDEYLSARIDDIDQVIRRVLLRLQPDSKPILMTGKTGDDDDKSGMIVVADDLSPADLSLLHDQGITGLITEHGTPLSHTSILARSLKIPAIQGVHHARELISNDQQLIIDADHGLIISDPESGLSEHYEQLMEQQRASWLALNRDAAHSARTVDGKSIRVQANIDLPDDLDDLDINTVDGIGLYRTEYLFLNRNIPPDEDEQYHAYCSIITAMRGKPVTIRTLDLGADKQPGTPVATGVNPALGLRAIRLCLNDHRLFYPQVRALLRASVHGPLRILIPMLSTSTEVFQFKTLFNQARSELLSQGVEVGNDIQLGGMIEVPAAALSTRTFAKHLDFLSIGTNDLIQYTLAIDRVDDQVNYLYDPLHPSVLRLLKMIIDESRSVGTPLTMCGEMAGDRRFVRLLLGMGMTNLSMQASRVAEVKSIIRQTSTRRIKSQVRKILNASHPNRIRLLVEELQIT